MRTRCLVLSMLTACTPTKDDPPVDAEPVVTPAQTPEVDTDPPEPTPEPVDDPQDTDPPPLVNWIPVGTLTIEPCDPADFCWDNTSAQGDRIHDLVVSGDDDTWTRSGDYGIAHFEAGTWWTYHHAAEIEDLDANGDVAYFLSEGSLHRVAGLIVERQDLPVPLGFETAVAVSPAGEIVVGGDSGVRALIGNRYVDFGGPRAAGHLNWEHDLWAVGATAPMSHDGVTWLTGPSDHVAASQVANIAPGQAWIASAYSGLLRWHAAAAPELYPQYVGGVAAVGSQVWLANGFTVTDAATDSTVLENIVAVDSLGDHAMAIGPGGTLWSLEDEVQLTEAITCGRVHAIAGTADDIIAGCDDGLLRKEGGVWSHMPMDGDTIYDVVRDGGTTWALSFHELHRMRDGEETVTYPVDQGRSLALDHEGTLWVIDHTGVYRIAGDEIVRDGPTELEQHLSASSSALYGSDGNRGLWQRQQDTWQPVSLPARCEVNDLLATADGGVAVSCDDGGRGGIKHWDTQTWTDIGQGIDWPTRMAGDPADELWVLGRSGHSLHHIVGGQLTTYPWIQSMVRVQLLDDGTLAMGHVHGGILLRRP